jgi:hypothetical protein
VAKDCEKAFVKEQKPRPRDWIRQAIRKPKARSANRHSNGKSEEQERWLGGGNGQGQRKPKARSTDERHNGKSEEQERWLGGATGRANANPRPAARTSIARARAGRARAACWGNETCGHGVDRSGRP